MVQWPPSPTVEDEATSLAKEHGSNNLEKTLHSDDQSVPSRGEVDQYPVIVDSDTNTEIPVKEASKSSRNPIFSKRAEQPHVSTMFRDETGLPTPPPSDNEAWVRSNTPEPRKDKDEQTRSSRSKSTTRAEETRQPRPAISRIQTDVAGELHMMKRGTRRAPSPYSYTRESGTFRVEHAPRHSPNAFLSPAHAKDSPVSIQDTTQQRERSAERRDCDNSTDSERRSKRSLRFAEAHQGPATRQDRPSTAVSDASPQAAVQDTTERRDYAGAWDSSERRRYVKVDQDVSGTDVPRKAQRSRSRATRTTSKVRESPYSSSAEESVRSERYGSTKKASSDEQPVRRRSSHRRERPRLAETSSLIVAQNKSGSSDDDATRRVYRVRDGRSPMTPPTVTTPDHMEDYFSKAFQTNASRPSTYTPRSSVDETPLYSPPTSPPRTPRTDRPSRQELNKSPSSSPHRTPQHSRGPSLDEIQLRELKTHTSLLSQATAAAAALASKASPPVSRSASNAIETTFACSSNGPVTRPRSRASSPQRERARRSDAFTYGEQAMPRIIYPPVPHSKRPSTRDGLPKIELSTPGAISPPQRNASWTGYDQQYRVQGGHFGGPLHTMTAMSTTLPTTQLNAAPPMYRSQSASTPQDLTQKGGDFTLPQCPRSQPTQGLRDWCSIRDMPGLDICPKCMQAISATRYRTLLVRSLDKPYDKSTVCAFSKAWIRTAFIQCVKQNKPDMSLVRKASILPEGARPCEGSKPDVRMWWKLIDPSTDRAVPDFFACSACVGSVHQIFPDLPDQFRRDVLNQEKVCNLHPGSKHFNTFMEQLDQVAEKCRDRGKSSARYMQPFVDHIRRVTRHPECARDTLMTNRAWHFMNDLPEFSICEACYEEVVWPQREKPVARDISKVMKIVPHSAFRGSGVTSSASNAGVGTHPVSCQLYSERMRRMFADVVSGRISFEMFRSKVKERHAAQYRLTEMNKMYEEDQRMGWDRRADIEKNRQYWRSLE
ncbi:hypothetical protein PMZ80_009465 [Knufia obscura]|uniref:Uncharacterized protein n=2 Tax=Knufia TaxID=430999 RepID=A0AAN8IIZ4_9EURO|nr:hypothetical protein PMZ80_009465 [Knufia obscura]KAK5949597.1 hypothetical protein OHC33_009404 [Knufia fluminis]